MPAHKKTGTVVWSPELAYAIGLITTDGSLSKDGRHFDFTSNDRDLIKTFKKCLRIKNKISRKRSGFTKKLSSFHIQFGDVILYKFLLDIGLMPNKSKRVGDIEVPDRLFFDFLRGHLDGDGTVRKYADPVFPKSIRVYLTFMSASLKHLHWLNEKIKTLAGVKGFFRTAVRAHTLTFSKKDSITLLALMYHREDVPCLRRKFVIISDLIKPE